MMNRLGNKRRISWLIASVIAGIVLGLAIAYKPQADVESARLTDGHSVKFRTHRDAIEVYEQGEWRPFFVKGVNVGASLPGFSPGELPITKEHYLRWFSMISEMGADVIRIYTIHPPAFYEALVEYNREKQGRPLYFIQGVWTPEEALNEKRDAYLPEITSSFREEIAQAVGAVYGGITIPERPGKAGGTYTANAGPYLLAWSIGTEWDPHMVDQTNRLHRQVPEYRGEHFRSAPGASPFEKWLASMLDFTAQQESRHGWEHPMTFTNWITTDPLQHPGEPLYDEDLVGVDPTRIQPVHWDAGYFASYHVYPYYPDFLRLDKQLQTVKNSRGEIDPYKAYLRQLKQYHRGLPVMVTEFGVPSSLGVAHLGHLGRNQGGHDERRQGEIDADLLRQIYDEGLAGAVLFSWQDEWFKKTWNTMDFELPQERKPLWLNVLTNESMFGVLGMYPNKDGVLYVDGDDRDWDALPTDEKQRLGLSVPGFDEIWMAHDEAYVYIMARLTKPFDPAREVLYLGVDTLPGGNRHAPELMGRTLDEGLETLIALGRDNESAIRVASNYDVHRRLYGKRYGMMPVDPKLMQDDSGVFVPWKLTVSLEMKPPNTKVYHKLEDVTVGGLRRGSTRPDDPGYNTLAAWQAKGRVVELRIPWMLLGVSDPSSRRVISYDDSQKSFATVETKGIRLVPWIVERASRELIGIPAGGTPYAVSALPRYEWNGWDRVTYRERPKQSYAIMRDAFRAIEQEERARHGSPDQSERE